MHPSHNYKSCYLTLYADFLKFELHFIFVNQGHDVFNHKHQMQIHFTFFTPFQCHVLVHPSLPTGRLK